MSQASNLPQGAEELTKHLLNILPSNNNNNNSQSITATAPSPQHLPNEESSKQKVSSPIGTSSPKVNTQSPTHSEVLEKETMKKDINTPYEQQEEDNISSSELENRQKQSRSISPNEINQLWSQLSKKLDKHHQDTTNTISPIHQQNNNNNNRNKPYYYYNNNNINEEEGGEYDNNYDRGIWTIGFFLFWFGFLCPILWIIGSFWPKKPDHHGKMAHRWQMINRAMAIGFCIILICILIAMGIWYSQTSH